MSDRSPMRPVPPAKRAVPPDGYQLPQMPDTLPALRKWVRSIHDAFGRGAVAPNELDQARRSAAAVADLHRVIAELRKAAAAERTAQAEEKMAAALAAVQFGGAALVMLNRLREGLADEGKRRPLPGRVRVLPSPPSEPAS